MEDIRPDFLRTTDELKAAEEQATRKKMENREDELDSAREDEENPRGFYRGTGRPIISPKKGGIKGFMKKHAPMMVITALIGGAGAMMMGLQTLMPMAIAEMIIEKFNSVGISSTETSDVWLDAQLNQGSAKDYLAAGEMKNVFGLSSYQQQSLESQGIRVVYADDVGGAQLMTLLYRKGDGWVPVIGSRFLNNDQLSREFLIDKIRAASGVGAIMEPISVEVAFEDEDFYKPYTTASKTWRGGNSGWFDKIMSNLTETKLSVRRNRWARFTAGALTTANSEFSKVAASASMAKTSDAGLSKMKTTYDQSDSVFSLCIFNWCPFGGQTEVNEVYSQQSADIYDENNQVRPSAPSDADGLNASERMSGVSNTNQIVSVLNSRALKAASQISSVGCAVVEGMMSIYTLVSAYQSMQFLNLVSGFLESVDKVKAGDGSESAIHEYGNNLTTAGDTRDNNGNVMNVNKTAMESAGMAWLFNRDNSINPNDPSVKNVNMENMMSNLSSLTGNIEMTAKIYEACGYVKVANSVYNLATTVISFVPIIGGGVKAAQLSIKAFARVAVSAAVVGIFYVAIPVIARKVANTLISDAATEWFGEDLGNAMVSGANKYLGGNGTSGGEGPGSRTKVLAYLGLQGDVIAKEAEYQRSIRSPFDVTSKYTFMGSLARTMLPMAYASGGVTSAMKGVSGLTSSAIIAMLPTASAIDEQSVLGSTGDCALLDGLGIVGDAFCNAYIVTDVATIDNNPAKVYQNAYYLDGYYDWYHWEEDDDGEMYYKHDVVDYRPTFDGSGDVVMPICGNIEGACITLNADNTMYKPHLDEVDGYEYYSNDLNEQGVIKSGSNLDKYVNFCGTRTSQYGIKDAAIAERITKQNEEGLTAMKIMRFTPGLSDIVTIIDELKVGKNMAWTTGEACVVSEANPYWVGPEMYNSFYQRYAENDRLLENTTPGYKSAVAVAVEEYWEEDPLDDSFEGQLARFSGMSVEQVEDTLALIEYYEFLNEYDASKRVAFGVEEVLVEDTIWFENDAVIANDGVVEMANSGFGGGFSYMKRPYNIWFGEIWYGNAEKRQTVA